jgi:hypothetical protein
MLFPLPAGKGVFKPETVSFPRRPFAWILSLSRFASKESMVWLQLFGARKGRMKRRTIVLRIKGHLSILLYEICE